MRAFKRKREPETAESLAAATRLQAVTDRGKDEKACYPVREVPVAVPALQRLFLMPAALSPESSSA
jgi:hypothetical protein